MSCCHDLRRGDDDMMPLSRLAVRGMSSTTAPVALSKLPVGSSAKMMRGLLTSAPELPPAASGHQRLLAFTGGLVLQLQRGQLLETAPFALARADARDLEREGSHSRAPMRLR
jgi:hypothetical protein